MAGLCTYVDVPSSFIRPSACGAIITAKVGSTKKIIDHFTGIQPMQRAYVFPAITVEEWNRVVTITEETMAADITDITANYFVPTTAHMGTTVYTPSRFIDKVMRPREAEHQVTGGLTTVAGLPGN